MTTVNIMTASTIPGLQRSFTKEDLKESTIIYNGLPRIQSEMCIDMNHVRELVGLITRHGQLGKFSFHLVHQHDPIARDTIRLESDIGIIRGKWNKATAIDSVDLTNIHGVVFKFVPAHSRLVPYEFGQGPSPICPGDVDDEFVLDFTRYLAKNNLTNIFALEVVHPVEGGQPNECTAEVEVDKLGTVVLPKSSVNAQHFLPTGWPGLLQPGDGDPPPGQTWAKRVDNSHKVFINKPIGTARELVNELVRQGVLNA